MTIYKQKKQLKAEHKEAVIGSILGGLFILVILGFMFWHAVMVDKWLGAVIGLCFGTLLWLTNIFL